MAGTRILFFHSDPARSRVNAALAARARDLPDTEVVDMAARYPDDRVDLAWGAAVEAQGLLAADRIVLQFPIHWYAGPPLLKAWQDAVLTRMYYIHAETEGDRLAGTPLMIAATAGNGPTAYRRGGQNGYALDAILTPLKATARRCGLPWHRPYLVYGANRMDEAALATAATGYAGALRAFAARTARTAAV
ncbi:NAD(P)H-dependent oxidoreductase [Jannaschia marina]|uniref:NAD(P)H-dependent oxidoreductase n=1 Tax=Jannaschia marina TaxID=2741674 RepID=UPI0015CB3B60|nr:NAD(P)H-dependent oxidoreductase [Jannaschia marina]